MATRNFAKTLFISLLILVNFSFQFGAVDIFATDVEEYEEDLEQKEKEKAEKEKILAQTRSEIDAIYQSGASIDGKIYMITELLESLSNRITQKEEEIVTRDRELSEKEEYLKIKQQTISEVSTILYKNSKVSILEAVLSQGVNGELIRGLNYRKYVLDVQTDTIRALTQEYIQIQVERDIMESQ